MKRAADTETSERAIKQATTRGALHPDELETINEGSSATVPDINEINTIHETYPDGQVIQDVESVHH
jgi:3-oxoacyl-(acyl-carrier-protein) synthase